MTFPCEYARRGTRNFAGCTIVVTIPHGSRTRQTRVSAHRRARQNSFDPARSFRACTGAYDAFPTCPFSRRRREHGDLVTRTLQNIRALCVQLRLFARFGCNVPVVCGTTRRGTNDHRNASGGRVSSSFRTFYTIRICSAADQCVSSENQTGKIALADRIWYAKKTRFRSKTLGA